MVRGARHQLTFSRMPVVTDTTAGGFAPTATPTTVTVWGSLDLLTAREVERAATLGTRATASARVDLGTDVSARDTMTAADGLPALDDQLAGEWEVAAVQHTRSHLRVMLRRSS